MSTAWKIVLTLTFARMTMGFQFQAIPSLAPVLTGSGGFSYAALGTLTGAYLVPGVIVALAGGWLGRLLGDARVVSIGLLLMAAGGFAGALVSSFEAQLVWRLIAGCGAVCLNVLVTKMVADWFEANNQLPTAMGVLVASWPAGIALCALALPLIEAATGLFTALLVPGVLSALALMALRVVWQEAPVKAAGGATPKAEKMLGVEVVLVVLAGLIWGLYNTVFVGVVAWVPTLLSERGAGDVAAAAYSSSIVWVAIFSVVAGGVIAGRVARPDIFALGSFLISGVLIAALAAVQFGSSGFLVLLLLGGAIGPAAAIIMTLPVAAARAPVRASAMGLYFALYYAIMAIAPPVYGRLHDATQSAIAPLYAMSLVMIVCVMLWGAFRFKIGRPAADGTSQ